MSVVIWSFAIVSVNFVRLSTPRIPIRPATLIRLASSFAPMGSSFDISRMFLFNCAKPASVSSTTRRTVTKADSKLTAALVNAPSAPPMPKKMRRIPVAKNSKSSLKNTSRILICDIVRMNVLCRVFQLISAVLIPVDRELPIVAPVLTAVPATPKSAVPTLRTDRTVRLMLYVKLPVKAFAAF